MKSGNYKEWPNYFVTYYLNGQEIRQKWLHMSKDHALEMSKWRGTKIGAKELLFEGRLYRRVGERWYKN